MRLPEGAYAHRDTVVLLAVVASRRPTVRAVAAATGYGTTAVHRSIHRLGTAGLVAFEPGRGGTLRAAVRRAA